MILLEEGFVFLSVIDVLRFVGLAPPMSKSLVFDLSFSFIFSFELRAGAFILVYHRSGGLSRKATGVAKVVELLIL